MRVYVLFLLFSDLEAYVVSYRDTRDKGGKVFYNLLLLGLGVTLPYVEAGLSMELGELVVVRVSSKVALAHHTTHRLVPHPDMREKPAVYPRSLNLNSIPPI